mmetsp:Transcript_64571/g.188902  ORF Transcript_64571/g.188902 Transcript_64571/m.188902 type:complete len:518 (-) Transcript_64571:197-1750(-)
MAAAVASTRAGTEQPLAHALLGADPGGQQAASSLPPAACRPEPAATHPRASRGSARRAATQLKGHKIKELTTQLAQATLDYRALCDRVGIGGDTVTDRLSCLAPSVEAALCGSRLDHDARLRRNVAAHAERQPAPVSSLTGRQLRGAQRGLRRGCGAAPDPPTTAALPSPTSGPGTTALERIVRTVLHASPTRDVLTAALRAVCMATCSESDVVEGLHPRSTRGGPASPSSPDGRLFPAGARPGPDTCHGCDGTRAHHASDTRPSRRQQRQRRPAASAVTTSTVSSEDPAATLVAASSMAHRTTLTSSTRVRSASPSDACDTSPSGLPPAASPLASAASPAAPTATACRSAAGTQCAGVPEHFVSGSGDAVPNIAEPCNGDMDPVAHVAVLEASGHDVSLDAPDRAEATPSAATPVRGTRLCDTGPCDACDGTVSDDDFNDFSLDHLVDEDLDGFEQDMVEELAEHGGPLDINEFTTVPCRGRRALQLAARRPDLLRTCRHNGCHQIRLRHIRLRPQ